MPPDNHAAPHGFVEDWSASDEGHYDFDWEMLFRNLGEGEPDGQVAKLSLDDRKAVCRVLRGVLKWIADGLAPASNAPLRVVGHRTAALIWCIDPQLFGQSKSLTRLASEAGVHKMTLSDHAARAREFFGTQNDFTDHDWRTKGGVDAKR